MRIHRLCPVLLVALLGSRAWAGTPADVRLASELARVARALVRADPPTVHALTAATIVAEEAAFLDPDDANRWRMVRDLALHIEDDERYARAVGQIIRIDPKDGVARLHRINLEIERYQNIETRVAAYERFLDPARRDQVGAAVASRLALDLALLLKRGGDVEGFAHWLAEAATIDPTNRSAAAIAAGFFRMHVNDPFAEAELLIDLALADPTDLTTQTAIARLMLDHGAYVAAERFYTIATSNFVAMRRLPFGTLLADRATAEWGAGHEDRALHTVRARQQAVDDAAQMRLRIEHPEMTPIERGETRGTINPTLAVVRAAILASRDDAGADVALVEAIATLERSIVAESGERAPSSVEAQILLQMAWIAVWLGDDVDRVETFVNRAAELEPLTEAAQRRFEGWTAMRRGEPETAIAAFRTIADNDPASQLGLAEAYFAGGQSREAARGYLAIARAQPGSLIGIWANARLAGLLGQRAPLNDTASRLEKLTETIPSTFDRYPMVPSLAVSLSVKPERMVLGPHEPIVINVIVTNNGPTPLAIDREGPIHPGVVLSLSTEIERLLPPTQMPDGSVRPSTLKPIVVEIDHRLRLEPGGRLVVPVNLLEYAIGDLLDSLPRRGAFLKVKGSLNPYRFTSGALEPGLLGGEEWTDTIRIDGVRIDPEWMSNMINALADVAGSPPDEQLVQIALVMDVVCNRLRADAPPEFFQYIAEARDRMSIVFRRLDTPAQAWLLATIPPDRLLEHFSPLVERARLGDDRLLRLTYLLLFVRSLDDPVLADARASSDEPMRVLAESLFALWMAAASSTPAATAPTDDGR